jgi:hypothetical protein
MKKTMTKITLQELSAKMWTIQNASDDWEMGEYMACWKGLMDYFSFKFKEVEDVQELLGKDSYLYDQALNYGVEDAFEEAVEVEGIDMFEKFTAQVELYIEPIKTKSNA